MDRLTIINDALLATGNNRVNVEWDSSVEWQASDSAYRRAVAFLLSRHTWGFANTSAVLAGLLPESPHPLFDKAFQLPGDCLLVQSAWLDGRGLTEYEIMDQKFCSKYDADLLVKYVRAPDVNQWPPLFTELLTMKVEEQLFRSLNEDMTAARTRAGDVEAMLGEVRGALDRQEPAKAIFRSRTAWRRRGGRSLTRFDRPPYDSVP